MRQHISVCVYFEFMRDSGFECMRDSGFECMRDSGFVERRHLLCNV